MRSAVSKDTVLAICAIGFGAMGIWLTIGYVPKARHFPMALSAVILVSGVIILLMSLRERGAGRGLAPLVAAATSAPPETEQEIRDRRAATGGMLRGSLPFGLMLIAWAVVVSFGAGYLLPSFAVGLALMWISGARAPVAIAAGAGGTVLFCFTMFYIVFQTRIPETVFVKSLVAPLRSLF